MQVFSASRNPTLSTDGIQGTMSLIDDSSLEAPVQHLWNTIIPTWFPSIEGYSMATNSAHLNNNNEPDIIVTHHYKVGVVYYGTQILLVECKPPGDAVRSHGWEDTIEGQFHDDLTATLNASARLYGAVAIGKKVQFFKFDGREAGVTKQLTEISARLDLEANAKEIEDMLNHVKQHAPMWSRS